MDWKDLERVKWQLKEKTENPDVAGNPLEEQLLRKELEEADLKAQLQEKRDEAEALEAQLRAKLEEVETLRGRRNAEPKAVIEESDGLETTHEVQPEVDLEETVSPEPKLDPERIKEMRKAISEYTKVVEHLTSDELKLTRDRLAGLVTSTGQSSYKIRGLLVEHTIALRASGDSQGNSTGRFFLSKGKGLYGKAACAYRVDNYPETKDIHPGQLVVSDQAPDTEDSSAAFPMWSNETQKNLLSGVDSTSQKILDAMSPQRMEEIWVSLRALRTKLLEGGEEEQWITFAAHSPLQNALEDVEEEDLADLLGHPGTYSSSSEEES